MQYPVIENGVVYVANDSGREPLNPRRKALPHEVVPALVVIVERLQDLVDGGRDE